MAVDRTIAIKRLTYIKYLYLQGVEQAKLPETIAGFALMQFHDCVEMFLLLVAENLEKKKFHEWKFMEFWSNIDSLTMRDAMDVMKNRRVSLKHHGSFPSHDDVLECCINVGTFLRENIKIQFNIDFESISLIDLISYESVKELLQEASNEQKKGNLYQSLVRSRRAFEELLNVYEGSKIHSYQSILNVGKWQSRSYRDFVREVSLGSQMFTNLRWFRDMTETVNELRNVTKIIALGIDYKKYALFNTVTPYKSYFLSDSDVESEESLLSRVILSEDLCSMCKDFVIDSAVKLQDSDYDISKYLASDPRTDWRP